MPNFVLNKYFLIIHFYFCHAESFNLINKKATQKNNKKIPSLYQAIFTSTL